MKKTDSGMVMFRNSRKGYDKNDVNRYIEDMNIRFTTAEQRYISTVRMLENDLEKAKANGDDKEKAASLEAELSAMRAELNSLKAELEAKENELNALKTEPKPSECPFKAEEKHEVTQEEAESKLGSILIKANLDAQRIVSEAEAERARIISEAEKAAESIRFDAAVEARLMTENAKKELALMSDEYIKGLNELSRDSADEYRRLYEEMKIKFAAAELAAKAKITNQ